MIPYNLKLFLHGISRHNTPFTDARANRVLLSPGCTLPPQYTISCLDPDLTISME